MITFIFILINIIKKTKFYKIEYIAIINVMIIYISSNNNNNNNIEMYFNHFKNLIFDN